MPSVVTWIFNVNDGNASCVVKKVEGNMKNQCYSFFSCLLLLLTGLLISGCSSSAKFERIPDRLRDKVFVGSSSRAEKEISIAEAKTDAMLLAYASLTATGSVENLKAYLLAANIDPIRKNNILDPVEVRFVNEMQSHLRWLDEYSDSIKREKGDSTWYETSYTCQFDGPVDGWISNFCDEQYGGISGHQENAMLLLKQDDFINALSYLGKSNQLTTTMLGMLGDRAQSYNDFGEAHIRSRQVIVDLLTTMDLVPPVRRIFYMGDTMLNESITLTLYALMDGEQIPVLERKELKQPGENL